MVMVSIVKKASEADGTRRGVLQDSLRLSPVMQACSCYTVCIHE